MKGESRNIQLVINACLAGNEAGQRKLYELFFAYGMNVSMRYSSSKEDAEDILNESFFKVFSKIDQYDEQYAFKKWFRRILINTSIDYYRKYKKLRLDDTIEHFEVVDNSVPILEKLKYKDVLKYVQLLPPRYRLVFNLFAIDGFKHIEIAEQLDISIGTSKSNYARAKRLLQSYLEKSNEIKSYNNGR